MSGRISELRALIDQYQRAKLEADKWAKDRDDLKKQVIKFMQVEELDSFEATSCKASLVNKENVAVPKDPKQKQAVYAWIRENFGEEHLQSMLSIHSQTFNSFFKECSQNALEQGDIDFNIPGIEPFITTTVALRKK